MIVITGASDGLGKQFARVCKKNGKTVVNISRTPNKEADYNFLYDLTKGSEIIAAAQEVSELSEPLETIVNCAGVMSLQPLGQITEDEIKRVMATNVKSQILLVSELVERIKKDETDIINVASTVGTKGVIDNAAYGASKWAVRGFSANLQAEFKGLPNRVISFCVGGFKSEIAKKITGEQLSDPENWMDPDKIAEFMWSILLLPKNAEVSEIIINRKSK